MTTKKMTIRPVQSATRPMAGDRGSMVIDRDGSFLVTGTGTDQGKAQLREISHKIGAEVIGTTIRCPSATQRHTKRHLEDTGIMHRLCRYLEHPDPRKSGPREGRDACADDVDGRHIHQGDGGAPASRPGRNSRVVGRGMTGGGETDVPRDGRCGPKGSQTSVTRFGMVGSPKSIRPRNNADPSGEILSTAGGFL